MGWARAVICPDIPERSDRRGISGAVAVHTTRVVTLLSRSLSDSCSQRQVRWTSPQKRASPDPLSARQTARWVRSHNWRANNEDTDGANFPRSTGQHWPQDLGAILNYRRGRRLWTKSRIVHFRGPRSPQCTSSRKGGLNFTRRKSADGGNSERIGSTSSTGTG